MNSGSRLSFHASCRCGARPKARQIRDTADCDSPSCAARDRVDQCVASAGVLSNVRTITASTCSSGTVRGRPGRRSSSSPCSRYARNRDHHLRALPTAIRNCCPIAVVLLDVLADLTTEQTNRDITPRSDRFHGARWGG